MSNRSKSSSKNVFSNFNIISKQIKTLFDILTTAINIKINRLENEFCQLFQAANININLSTQFLKNSKINHENFRLQADKNCTAEKIKFFDLTANESEFVINLNKYVFYKNVYVFVNRLQNVAAKKKR